MDPELLLTIFGFVILVTMVVGISVNGIVQKVPDFKRETRALEKSNGSGMAGSQIAARSLIEGSAKIEETTQIAERMQ